MKHEAVIALMILAAWACAFALIVTVSALRGARTRLARAEVAARPQDSRSENHNTQIHALAEWLLVPKIVMTMCHARVATKVGLQVLLDDLAVIPEEQLALTVAILLEDRDVRRVIAGYHCAKHPEENRERLMRALLLWTAPLEKWKRQGAPTERTA